MLFTTQGGYVLIQHNLASKILALFVEIDNPRTESQFGMLSSLIEFEWVKRFCPDLWFHRPPSSCSHASSISHYLDEVFFMKRGGFLESLSAI